MIYIGVDVGANGGIAVLPDNENDIETYVYTDMKLRELAGKYKDNCKVTVEKVHSMPSQGVASTFSFGRAYGYILGVLEANGINYTLVDPRLWKGYFGVTADKQTSIQMCRKLFPDVNLKRTDRCRTYHDGKAEALLIALYGLRNDRSAHHSK